MTLEEARKIMTYPEHPLHKRYKQSDPIVTGEPRKEREAQQLDAAKHFLETY